MLWERFFAFSRLGISRRRYRALRPDRGTRPYEVGYPPAGGAGGSLQPLAEIMATKP